MKNFIEARFPDDISYGSSGGPEYYTDIIITASGTEQRNINRHQARVRYNITHGVKTEPQLQQLLAFFRTCKGKAIGFRFKDWSDYKASNQNIGIGNGSDTIFQLIKTYGIADNIETRIISKPVRDTVKIYINNSEQQDNFHLDYTTGRVQFPTPPKSGAIITATFEFDIPARFDTDCLASTLDNYGIFSCNDIAIIEIKV